MSDRRAVDDGIMNAYRSVSRNLEQQTLPTWLKLGITMPQFKALVAVAGSAGITVTKLGCELSIGQSSASLMVDQLVNRGYVERTTDPEDRRRVLVTATSQGEDLLGELRHGRRQTFAEWLERLDDDDAAALSRGLSALASIAQADRSSAEERAPCAPGKDDHGSDHPTV